MKRLEKMWHTLLALVVLKGLEASKGGTTGNELMTEAGLVIEVLLRLVGVGVVCGGRSGWRCIDTSDS